MVSELDWALLSHGRARVNEKEMEAWLRLGFIGATKEQLQHMIRVMDSDGDGYINLQECSLGFRNAWFADYSHLAVAARESFS